MAIERVLIHPFPNTYNWRGVCKIWRLWESYPTTKIIEPGDFNSLEDTTYLNQVEGNLIVGGQAGTVCVGKHLSFLANDQRVKNGIIRVNLSEEATIISPPSINYLIMKIFVEQGVKIEVVD